MMLVSVLMEEDVESRFVVWVRDAGLTLMCSPILRQSICDVVPAPHPVDILYQLQIRCDHLVEHYGVRHVLNLLLRHQRSQVLSASCTHARGRDLKVNVP
jgi:hypothetical protein